jgi:hypothetical protein
MSYNEDIQYNNNDTQQGAEWLKSHASDNQQGLVGSSRPCSQHSIELFQYQKSKK